MISRALIEEQLSLVIYSGFTKNIVEFGFVKDINIEGEKVTIKIEIPSSSDKIEAQLREEITKRISIIDSVSELNLTIIQPKVLRETSSHGKNVLPNIKNFVMVSSGKGGVGKSTTTVNIAIALAQQGKRVGLLDVDIYGPNIPRMMGIEGNQPVFLGKTIKPIMAHNIKVMSIGLLVERGFFSYMERSHGNTSH